MPAGSGPEFANAVALIATSLGASQVLEALHEIEARHGRDRSTGRWSARVLDLDLIAMDNQIVPDAAHLRTWMELSPERQRIQTPDRLILPHPRMQDRPFVLAPLAEIAPDWHHPLTGATVATMLAALGPAALEGLTPVEFPGFS